MYVSTLLNDSCKFECELGLLATLISGTYHQVILLGGN